MSVFRSFVSAVAIGALISAAAPSVAFARHGGGGHGGGGHFRGGGGGGGVNGAAVGIGLGLGLLGAAIAAQRASERAAVGPVRARGHRVRRH